VRQQLTPERKEHLKALRRVMGEEVYFIEDVDSGRIKIGYAADPKGRLYRLQCGNPGELRLLATIPHEDAQGLEGHLHSRFHAHRGRGEWFAPAPELVRMIRVINRQATPDDVITSVVFVRDRRGYRARVDWAIKAHGWTVKEWQAMGEAMPEDDEDAPPGIATASPAEP
jgi:hypothetical protein